jgi:UDP-glucose 4,6-dehydratase
MILLGAKGYIAQAFSRELKAQGLGVMELSRDIVDYTQFKNLFWILSSLKPELVINCAAFIHKGLADACEDRKSDTLRTNLVFPSVLSNACEETGTKLLHVSTGCLYFGDNGGKGWTEKDTPQLSFNTHCGVYVGSKELAEQIVSKNPMSYICRIRLPFDEFDCHRNYISKLMRYEKVVRATNSLSRRSDFVKACLHLWRVRAPFGIYNATNKDQISSRRVCELITHVLKPGKEFQFWNDEEFQNTVARTPKSNCKLSVEKLLATGFNMPPVEDAIFESLKHWVPEKH